MTRHQTTYRLRTWDAIFEAFADIKIDQPYKDGRLDNNIIATDLKLIQGYTSSRYLLGNDEKTLHEEIEQVQYFKEGTNYAFLDYIHELAELIREAEQLPNFKRSFKNNMFSNLGWFNQFLITVMLGRMYKVKNIEHKMTALKSGAKFDCDVEIEFAGKTVHCQIKDIAEHNRRDRLHDVKDSIEDGMDYPNGFNNPRRKQAYRIVDFKGSPPQNMPLEKWVELGRSLNMRQRKFRHTIPKDTYGKHEAKTITFKVHGFRRGSFRYSPADDFDNMPKLADTYNDIETRVANTRHTKKDHFLLIANSYTHPAWDAESIKAIRGSELSVMTVYVWGMSMIDFVTVAVANNLIDFEKDFNKRVKKAWLKII